MSKALKSLPNFLTILRILFCPAIFYFSWSGHHVTSLIIFLAVAATDFLDGYLARKLGAITTLGQLLDPLSDKIFSLSVFSLLMALGVCPPWFLGLILSTSLLQIVGYSLLTYGTGQIMRPVPTLRLSKWNTALQFLWIGLLLWTETVAPARISGSPYWPWIHFCGFILLACLQVNVFLQYFFLYRPQINGHFAPLQMPH